MKITQLTSIIVIVCLMQTFTVPIAHGETFKRPLLAMKRELKLLKNDKKELLKKNDQYWRKIIEDRNQVAWHRINKQIEKAESKQRKKALRAEYKAIKKENEIKMNQKRETEKKRIEGKWKKVRNATYLKYGFDPPKK